MYKTFICRKRAKFPGIDGPVNIPHGTVLACQDGFLMLKSKRVCAVTSQHSVDHFCQNDDGMGELRGKLVAEILRNLTRRDATYQNRWDRIWNDSVSRKYKRPEQDDYWLWSFVFYNAPVQDLQHIADLVRVGKEGK